MANPRYRTIEKDISSRKEKRYYPWLCNYLNCCYSNGNVEDVDLAICHDYDDAIKTILIVANQEHEKEYS